jgi:hypothetical protein
MTKPGDWNASSAVIHLFILSTTSARDVARRGLNSVYYIILSI